MIVAERNRLVEISQSFDWLDTGTDWSREKVFKLAAIDSLNTGFEIFVNRVSKLIFVLDPRNDPVVHFINQSPEITHLFLRIRIH